MARIEDYILGRFQRESVNVINATSGSAVTLEDLDLLPNLKSLLLQKEWPYVKQVYPGGEFTFGEDIHVRFSADAYFRMIPIFVPLSR